LRLGSEYGGWHLKLSDHLNSSFLLSGGAGEDISFDVEFVSKFNSKAVIVDPTPRAVQHFREVERRCGQRNSKSYSVGGCQDPDAYDLTSINESNLIFVEKALWSSEKQMRFYPPANAEYVSHTLIQSQVQQDNFIDVETISIRTLLREYEFNRDSKFILKLDIEGAEFEVISEMLSNEIFPEQIALEYDGLNSMSFHNFKKVRATHSILKCHSYKLIYTNYISNFLYTLH
jgi:FkbM family methyltransferase